MVCMDELDYFSAAYTESDKPIDVSVWDWTVHSKTDFGGNEGVYTDFYLRLDYDNVRGIATAKNLSSDDETFVRMHEFAARVCLIIRHYVKDRLDEFNWTGYDVGYWKNGKRVTYMLAHKEQNAQKYARELADKGERAWIRDNAKRTYQEIKED